MISSSLVCESYSLVNVRQNPKHGSSSEDNKT